MRGLSLLLLVGCSTSEDTGPVEDVYTPVPYVYDAGEPPAPELTLADIEAALDAAVATVPSLNAGPVFPAYAAAIAGSDGYCPAYYESDGSVYWYDQCTATGGAVFDGYSFYVNYDGYDDGSGVPYDGAAIYGVAEVVTPEGYTFVAGGSASSVTQAAETHAVYYSSIHGAFSWDGPGAEGTWLADGAVPDLDIYVYAASYGNYFQVNGGIARVGGLDAVVFDEVVIFADALGSACGSEPGGAVSVRDADGNWYDVVFDGPPSFEENEADPARCDGCGTAYFQGTEVGPVCSDFTRLIDFEGAPW
jgi:hypothetical protein